jgi:type IV pilus assembly protein PilN
MHFLVALGGATLGAVALSGVAYVMLNSMIDGQQARNARLRQEIKRVDKQIEEINSLESSKQKFIARMEIIEKLQRSRPEIVHVLDEIVRTLPEGTYLTTIKQTERRLRFDGVAQSSTRVSAFMRNIDSSEWLKNPELEVIESKKDNSVGSSFTLFADQVTHAGDDELDRQAPKGLGQHRVARSGGTP